MAYSVAALASSASQAQTSAASATAIKNSGASSGTAATWGASARHSSAASARRPALLSATHSQVRATNGRWSTCRRTASSSGFAVPWWRAASNANDSRRNSASLCGPPTVAASSARRTTSSNRPSRSACEARTSSTRDCQAGPSCSASTVSADSSPSSSTRRPVDGVDIHRPQPAPRLHLPVADGQAQRDRAAGQRQAVVRAQRVLEGGDARLDLDELGLRVGPVLDLDRLVLAEHVAGRLDLGRHPRGRLLPGRSGAAQQRERLAGERVHARAEQRIDGRRTNVAAAATSDGSVSSVQTLDDRHAAAHSLGHGTRGVLRTGLGRASRGERPACAHRRAHEARGASVDRPVEWPG